jgi:hypothetical protein
MKLPDSPSTIPAPQPSHLSAAAQLWDRLVSGARKIHAEHGRGLMLLTLDPASGSYQCGYTPLKRADVAHVMSFGVPEEAAITIVNDLEDYDMAAGAKFLILEAGNPLAGPFSYFDVRFDPASRSAR